MPTRNRARHIKMRKQPQQARSRATIQAILEAAAHILGRRGWEGLTTNAVAEAAGASIGSLYQYFPNKLSLVEAVRQRHFDEVAQALMMASDETLTSKQRVAALVDGMIRLHSRQPAVHRVLMEQTPRGEESHTVHDRFTASLHAHYEAIIRCSPRGAMTEHPRICAQALAAAVAGAVHDAAHRGTLRLPAFRTELVQLVQSFLLAR